MLARRLALLALIAVAGPASGQTRHDSNAPIDFSANAIEVQDKASRAVLTGDVAVRQAEMTVTSDRMTVAYTGRIVDGAPQVSRLDAAGNVVVTRPNQIGRSRFAVYDVNRRTVTMVGDVVLTENGNVTRGPRLTIDLDARRAVLGTTPGSGQRVSGRFTVPQRGESPRDDMPRDQAPPR